MSRSIPQINSDKPLGGRYKVISQLGVGGFGRTFLAEDLHLPGHPRCVVKQLKPQFKSDDTLQMARRCFNTEAEVLYQLGNHNQIPRLLAHFEDNQEFYLAQEFIEGTPLTTELVEGRPWSESKVLAFLQDVLQVLEFVHQQQVIHRDLKPSNLIRRKSDCQIVVIDFGAVKQVSTQAYEPETGLTNLTISIGTQGYMPNEQLAGKPRFNSDIYAVGVIGIQALTGIHPRHLGEDEKGEISWSHLASRIHPDFRAVLDKMVRYDFRDRFSTVSEVLTALAALPPGSEEEPPPFQPAHVAAKVAALSDRKPIADESHNSAHPPRSEFIAADLTVAGEEPLSTAVWLRADAPQAEQINPGQIGTGQVSAGQASTGQGNLTRNGTGVTHAIGRPYPEEITGKNGSTPTQTGILRQFKQPLTISLLVGLLVMGLGAVALQVIMPQWFNAKQGGTPTPASPGATPAPPALSSTDVPTLFNYANQLMQQKEYEQALQYFDRVTALKPDYAEAYAGRCETLNQLKRPEEAIVACTDALAYKPDYPEAVWSKGNALLLQGRTYEALKLYEDVTYLKPSYAPAWVKRGVALQKLGRSAEAVYALDQAISLQRNAAEAWSTRGAALLNLQRYDEAVISLDKALQLQNPDDPQTQKLREQARSKLKN